MSVRRGTGVDGMRRIGDHAVVLGAGIAGLLAARVVADAYGRVTVVERDPLPRPAGSRQGVPHGRHAHNLMPSGAQIIGELFPGLLDALEAAGAPVIRDFQDLRFAPAGHPLCLRGRSAEPLICLAGRPFLEGHLRSRVQALPSVGIVDRCEAVGLAATAARDRVTGVRILRRGGAEETLDADLVLDATGRSGRTPAWLAGLGYEPPPVDQLPIHVRYASRHLRLPPGALGGVQFVAVGAEPGRPTGFVLFAQEDDRWILTLLGYDGHHPPTDPDGFMAFVESVAPPDVTAAIRDAEPLDPVVAYRFSANRCRRYERLRRFPAGLLVFGDAICSTNPAYSLGNVGRRAAGRRTAGLARGRRQRPGPPVLPRRQEADRNGVAADGRRRPRPAPCAGPARCRPASSTPTSPACSPSAERDPTVAEQFFRVAALQHPPTRLFRPCTALRVLLGGVRPSSACCGWPRPATARRPARSRVMTLVDIALCTPASGPEGQSRVLIETATTTPGEISCARSSSIRLTLPA